METYWARSEHNEIYIHGKNKGRITAQNGKGTNGTLGPMRGVHPGEMFEGMQGFFPCTYFFPFFLSVFSPLEYLYLLSY